MNVSDLSNDVVSVVEHNGYYRIQTTKTSKYLGDVLPGDDGFYAYWMSKEVSGGWSEHALRHIADILEALNAPLVEELNVFFDS